MNLKEVYEIFYPGNCEPLISVWDEKPKYRSKKDFFEELVPMEIRWLNSKIWNDKSRRSRFLSDSNKESKYIVALRSYLLEHPWTIPRMERKANDLLCGKISEQAMNDIFLQIVQRETIEFSGSLWEYLIDTKTERLRQNWGNVLTFYFFLSIFPKEINQIYAQYLYGLKHRSRITEEEEENTVIKKDRALFQYEYPPDMSIVSPGERVIHTWVIKNVGDTPWENGYYECNQSPMELEKKTFNDRFFEKTPRANDAAYMTYHVEREKYVENYRVGETYNLEIPFDVFVKDAAKYYKNLPDLKETNMKGFFYYDAEKNAFICPEGGIGDAPPTVKVVKVDELGNKTYAIRFEFTDNIESPEYESEATLVVEDNGQGNWRYISFLKGYPEIAPIEPEKPEEPEKPTDPTPDKPSVNDPIVNPDTGKELSQTVVNKVVDQVQNAKKGSEVVVKMQEATTVPSEVLESAKGKDVDVVLDMGSYSWTINGKDVTADKLKDINLKVTMNSNEIPQNVIEKTADGDPVIQISLAHDGSFGFQADLKLNVGAKYKGLYAKLYYYNKEGKLEYVQSDKVEADGTVIFTFKHASDYAIILSKKDDTTNTGAKVENTTPKTGDSSPIAIYVCMMLLAGSLTIFAVRRRLGR